MPDEVTMVRVDWPQRAKSAFWAACVVLIAGGIGVLTARQLIAGENVVAVSVIAYVVLVAILWRLSQGNVPVVLIVAYLIGPVPADNIFTQVFIFPSTDYSLRARDLFFLADLLLIGALLVVRPPLPARKILRWWLAGLAILAVYPILWGWVHGVGQSFLALLQGATMPLRAIAIVWLIAGWASTRGWTTTLRDLTRTVVFCGGLLAIATLAAVLLAHGQLNYSPLNYPLVTGGRPALPGWGNNILANFFCVCIAILVFARKYLNWSWRWRASVAILLLIGLAFTEVRIAMLLALLIVEIPLVLAVLRRFWPSHGALRAIALAAGSAIVLVTVTVTLLPIINPRFQTLTPTFISEQISRSGVIEEPDPDKSLIDPETGVDLGGESLGTRAGLLRAAGHVWLHNPLIGAGWNGWGWGKNQASDQLTVAIDPHNGMAWLLADAGLLGIFLLYGALIVALWQRWHLWQVWAIIFVAVGLELINPNLRNGHFAVVVWALAALVLIGPSLPQRYTIRCFLRDASQWLRGQAPSVPSSTFSPLTCKELVND